MNTFVFESKNFSNLGGDELVQVNGGGAFGIAWGCFVTAFTVTAFAVSWAPIGYVIAAGLAAGAASLAANKPDGEVKIPEKNE